MKGKIRVTKKQTDTDKPIKQVPHQFDTVAGTKIAEIATQMTQLKSQAKQILADTKDVWSPLGRRAPFMREAFKNVALPVKSKSELIEKMGGSNRIVVAPSLRGHLEPNSVVDIVDSLSGFLDQVLPVTSWETLVRQIVSNEQHSRKGDGKKGANSNPLLRAIPKKNLKEIYKTPQRRIAAFGGEKFGEYRQAFERKRPALEVLAAKGRISATAIVLELRAFKEYSALISILDIEALIEAFAALQKANYAKKVSAKCASCITNLTNAEGYLNNCSDYLDNVLAAQTITATILGYNTKAENALESANQLIAQAVADLASAEANLQHIPENLEAQNGVAEAQDKLEQVQNLLSEITQKMAQAEDHKDILSIPLVSITIHCVEEDPCCDDDWNNVNVFITNETHPNVPEGSGTTHGNGRCTISGRFGNSTIHVQSEGPGGWNFANTFNVGNHSQTFTITEDLPGSE